MVVNGLESSVTKHMRLVVATVSLALGVEDTLPVLLLELGLSVDINEHLDVTALLAHLGNPRGLSSSSRGFLPAPAMPTGATTRARWRRVGAAEVLRAVPRTATLDATITDMASLFVRSVSAAGARRECGGNHSRVDADKSPGSVTVCASGRVRLERCNSSPIAPGPFVTKYLYDDMICTREITFL